MVARAFLPIALVLLWSAGCADPCAEGGMIDSPAALTVTPEEHPDGWGRADCQACHPIQALHLARCSPGVDYQRLDDEVQETGYDRCTDCHGSNGL